MGSDVLVIGAGLSGLAAAALLSKRGLFVTVIDKSYNPGGSCGTFKRDGAIFDQGAAMLYGFGEKGFNSHRFVFNCLEEPIDMIKHDLLYAVNFGEKRIRFFADLQLFAGELASFFPSEEQNIRRFYRDMEKMYRHVMVERPGYATPDETDRNEALRSFARHPLSYARFLSCLNRSALWLLKKYFKSPEIFKFFDKLTSTYCYTTLEESPAVLAAVMFVDNHIGGSYYPAGSTVFLPGKLEKVIEENGGEMLYEREAVKLLFEGAKPCGALLSSGERIYAENIVYSGTVWNLFGKLISAEQATGERIAWAQKQVPTYPSVVLYALVEKGAIPEGTAPVEMLANPDALDESEVTAYILSIDDKTLCGDDSHTVVAISPTFETWHGLSDDEYGRRKEREIERLTSLLEKRFPGFRNAVKYAEAATPKTIERYTNKNKGAVAGPKQMIGQHMFNRLHTRTEWDNLFCCGESTVMGTGTPTVTTSGISAANAVLKKLGLETYRFRPGMKNYVNMVEKPFTQAGLYKDCPQEQREVMLRASRCLYCERPGCSGDTGADIRGVMRRVTVGNFKGAKNIAARIAALGLPLEKCENDCVLAGTGAVEIRSVFGYLLRE